MFGEVEWRAVSISPLWCGVYHQLLHFPSCSAVVRQFDQVPGGLRSKSSRVCVGGKRCGGHQMREDT